MWLWAHNNLFEPQFPKNGHEVVGAGRLLDYLYGLFSTQKIDFIINRHRRIIGKTSGNDQDFKLQSSRSHAASQNIFVFKNLTSKLAFTLHFICSKIYVF